MENLGQDESEMTRTRRHKHNEPLQPLLMNKKQAAQLLNVSVTTIDFLIRDGVLPVKRLRARRMIPVAAIRAIAD
jgi:excisionase family DNA binding protein